ncbi:MAG: hypothetical protein DRO73_11010 [Candidatus Thorarchaeota archaeon]|nr:MAG: hypothetical protein DRO73_11010 [Candidatus Thorarchaeota archaeon]
MRDFTAFEFALFGCAGTEDITYGFACRVEKDRALSVTLEVNVDWMQRCELDDFRTRFVGDEMMECVTKDVAVNTGVADDRFEIGIEGRIEFGIVEELKDYLFRSWVGELKCEATCDNEVGTEMDCTIDNGMAEIGGFEVFFRDGEVLQDVGLRRCYGICGWGTRTELTWDTGERLEYFHGLLRASA